MNSAENIELLKEYGSYERHFNQLQGVYRGLASTWFLACFAGIGFLYSSDLKCFPLPVNLAASFVLLAVATIIVLFWLLDVMVYHKLLLAVLKASEKLETSGSMIELREFMKQNTYRFNVRRAVSIYYILPIGILVIASMFFLTRPSELKIWHIIAVSVWTLILICIGILIYIMQKRKQRVQRIILVRGHIGSGKTYVSKLISRHFNYPILRTDTIRQELPQKTEYSDEKKKNVYSILIEKASALLQNGKSVIIEGTFSKNDYINLAKRLAEKYGIRINLIEVQVNDDSIIESRLKQRKNDDSEATFKDYQEQKPQFETSELPVIIINNTAGKKVLKRIIEELVKCRL